MTQRLGESEPIENRRDGGASYAPTTAPGLRGGLIATVTEGGPAWRCGLRPGMSLDEVDGESLRDLIDWYWFADADSVPVGGTCPLSLLDPEDAKGFSPEDVDEAGNVVFGIELERDSGEAWGLEFADAVFDHVRTCCNTCTFCFMGMLPKGMRDALYLRDDDYRLSFLQGNFVTLTNMSDADVQRVIDHDLSPLHVSVHAVSADVRTGLIGHRAMRGIEVLERLLAGGVQVHAQIVLVPEVNDGEELDRTLAWLEERPGVLSVGIVPLGFTRFQERFDHGFTSRESAGCIIDQVRPFQVRSRRQQGLTRFHLADEFYLNARRDPPSADEYDGFPQYEDGIGMVRSFIDDWEGARGRIALLAERLCSARAADGSPLLLATGEGAASLLTTCIVASPFVDLVRVLPVPNRYFGGNVNVAGLITAGDIIAALLDEDASSGPLLLPAVAFNDDGLTLDGQTVDTLRHVTGRDVRMVSCTVNGLLDSIESVMLQGSVS